MDFFNRVNSELSGFINHYWVMEGELEEGKVYEILPMDHSEIIIRISGEFAFKDGDLWREPRSILFQGIKTKPLYLKQKGYAKTIGISFKPWGLYGFINESMDSFRDKVVDLVEYNEELSRELSDFGKKFLENSRFSYEEFESILLKYIRISERDEKAIQEIQEYIISPQNIGDFSKGEGISRRKLERNFSRYVGVSPKRFKDIRKFEDASRELLYSSEIDMNDIVYEGEYYDQPHFNREFKKFTEKTPGKFKKDDTALKSSIDFGTD